VETATPVAGNDGESLQTLISLSGAPSRNAVAFTRLPGTAPDPAGDAVRWFNRLGEVTARMHRHARGWDCRPGSFASDGTWTPWWDLRPSGVLARRHWFDAGWKHHHPSGAASYREAPRALWITSGPLWSGACGPAPCQSAGARLAPAHHRLDDCGFSWFMYDFATAVSFIEHQPTYRAAGGMDRGVSTGGAAIR